MTRLLPLVLLAALAPATAAQSTLAPDADVVRGPRAEALADSIFQAALDVEEARFAGVESIALHGEPGAIYFRVGADGQIECQTALRPGAEAEFGDAFCFVTLFSELGAAGEDAGEDEAFAVTVAQRLLAGRPTHTIGMTAEGETEDFDEMTLWVDAATSAIVRVQVVGDILPGQTTTMVVDRGDFREASGVTVPHTLRLEILDFADILLADVGMSADELLAEVQQRAAVEGTAEAAAMLAMVKSVLAKGTLVVAFRVDSVEVDGPLPAGLFDEPDGDVLRAK